MYLLRGDILASLGNETAAMMSYRDVVRVGEERVKQAALNVNGDSVLRRYCPVLSKVSVIDHHTKDVCAIVGRGG